MTARLNGEGLFVNKSTEHETICLTVDEANWIWKLIQYVNDQPYDPNMRVYFTASRDIMKARMAEYEARHQHDGQVLTLEMLS